MLVEIITFVSMSRSSESDEASDKSQFKVLTIGDGDLTLSLALTRAYGKAQLDLTASTLLDTEEELIRTYNNSQEVLTELVEHGTTVWFGIDATQLHHLPSTARFDFVLFHHPHLGLDTLLENEEWHARRHYILLSHYLWSAKQVLTYHGMVHLCLCGTQPQTWKVDEAARRHGLELVTTESTSTPMHSWLFHNLNELPAKPNFAAPRKFRNGKLGSKHALGKYGYQHRRTHGDVYHGSDMSVSGSVHMLFRKSADLEPKHCTTNHECFICGEAHDSKEALENHLSAPARPDASPTMKMVTATSNGIILSSSDVMTQLVEVETNDHNETEDEAANPIPYDTERNTATASAQCHSIVAQNHSGKRLRWYLRQPFISTLKHISKKLCDDLIKEGRVLVNSQVAMDSSRILSGGDTVTVLEQFRDQSTTNKKSEIDVVFQDHSLIVAFKPVGMRTLGSFSEATMEMSISSLVGYRYKSISKLDTGCSGLCVLKRHDCVDVEVTHIFTALVHGHVPDEWDTVTVLSLFVESMRRWKTSTNSDKRSFDDMIHGSSSVETMSLLCLERTASLSTLRIETLSKSAGLCNAVCFLLRKKGHPVVNDRFCRQEYLELPRSMRNLIKSRLCIGCYEVKIAGKADVIQTATPERLSARFWEQYGKPSVAK